MLGIDKCLTRSVTEGQGSFHGLNLRNQRFLVIIGYIGQTAGRLVLTILYFHRGLQAKLCLVLVLQGDIPHVGHLIHRRSLERYEHVVFICLQELIRGRHHIILIAERDRVLRELARQVFLLVERVFHLTHILGTMILEPVCIISLEEQMRIQVGRGLRAHTQTQPVDIVIGDHGVYRTDIYLAGMLLGAGLHKVLDKRLQYKNHVFESRHLLQTLHQHIHRALGLRKRNRPVLIPEIVSAHHGVRLFDLGPLTLEKLLRKLIEGIIRVTGSPSYLESLHDLHQGHLHNHVIGLQHPLPIGQLLELLNNIHIVYKVHPRFLGQVHRTFLHRIRRVGQYVKMPRETEVLRVIGDEGEMEALVLVHKCGVHNVKLIKRDGITGRNRTDERILQQTDIIVVNIHIRKDILQHRAQHISRCKQLVHTRRAHSFDKGLLTLGMFTVNFLRSGLVHRNREDEFIGFLTKFDLVFQERHLFIHAFFQHLGGHIIQ